MQRERQRKQCGKRLTGKLGIWVFTLRFFQFCYGSEKIISKLDEKMALKKTNSFAFLLPQYINPKTNTNEVATLEKIKCPQGSN